MPPDKKQMIHDSPFLSDSPWGQAPDFEWVDPDQPDGWDHPSTPGMPPVSKIKTSGPANSGKNLDTGV